MPKYRVDGKEYDSIVKARKAAMTTIDKTGDRFCKIYQYSQKYGNKWFAIGYVEWPGKEFHAIYTQDKMSMPRPNGIKDGQWVLDKNGRIVSTVSEFNRRRQKMWSKRYGN